MLPSVLTRLPAVSMGEASRVAAFDFTKGALVLIMVLYHWFNYFVSPQGYMYRYLRFLTPSFIFITGFLISHVYLSRYKVTDPRLSRRLTVRGAKVLGIFILLNVLIALLIPSAGREESSFGVFTYAKMVATFVTGNVGAGKPAAFSVLVPISYLLLLSSLLLLVCRVYRNAFHAACIAFFAGIVVLDWRGLDNGNLELLAIGLLGTSVGHARTEVINRFVERPYRLVLGYFCYVAAISYWNVTYPLQIVGLCLSLMLLYLLGSASTKPGPVRETINLLGRYSLLGYIAQIAVIQSMWRSTRHLTLGMVELSVSFVLAVGIVISLVMMVDRSRSRSAIVNKAYSAMFS